MRDPRARRRASGQSTVPYGAIGRARFAASTLASRTRGAASPHRWATARDLIASQLRL
jgi:hypothetical protein